MNVAPSVIKTVLASPRKDFICAIEFYAPSYIPNTVHGFVPSNAIARFATKTATFEYNGTTSDYIREVIDTPTLSRNKGKQSNSVTIRLSNIPKEDAPLIRPLALFVLNEEVEGMRVVIRILSRSSLLNGATSPAACSFVAFVGKCGRPDGFDRKQGTITARQDLGQIEAQIPPAIFQRSCRLDFGGPECLGTELLTEKSAAYQAAFASLGRLGCNKTFGQCTEFENTEFNQGLRVAQIEGSFVHRPHEGLLDKVIGLLTPGSGRRRTRVGASLEDGTPYGKAVPAVLGRRQMPGIPLQYQDIGTSINFLMAFCRGPIAGFFNIRSNTVGFTQPLGVTEHYGRYGGEADQLEDTVFPLGGFYSRLAYITGFVNGSDIAAEEPAPNISSMIAGSAIDLMDTIHLMNRCGSGRISGAGISYSGVLGDQWTDNPVELARVILFDDGLLRLNRNFLDVRRTAITSHYCNGAIRDDSNAERLLLPNTETARAGVDYHRYNSTSMITPYGWQVAVSAFPISNPAHEAAYEFFDPDDPPLPADLPVTTVYRKRFTANVALTEQRKALDFLYDVLLPSFRGFLSWNTKGQIGIRCERPADSVFLRTSSIAGATTLELEDVMPWKGDIGGAINEEGNSLIGEILIGVSLLTSEVRQVVSAAFTSDANDITLAASATGGTTATASGGTLTGGSSSSQSHGTITIGGSLAEGDTVTATINGIDSTYTLQADETADTVAAALGFAINANLVSQRIVEADNNGWNNFVDIYSKAGTVTLSSALEEAHDAGEETIRVMMSFAHAAVTYANTSRSNILNGTFQYLGSNGQTRYNQFKGTYFDPLRDFAEQPLVVNDYEHQEYVEKVLPLEIDLSAVDNYNQASRLLNGANAKFGDGVDFFSWSSNGLALQLEEGDTVCVSDPSGDFRNVPVTIEQLTWNKDYTVSFTSRIYSTSFFNDVVQQTDVTIPSGLTNFAAPPPDIVFNTVDFSPDGLEQSTDGTAGITSIRGGGIVGDSIYAQTVNVRLIKRGGVTVSESIASGLIPNGDGEITFEFVASVEGLYTVELEVCNQWGCNTTKPTADIVIGLGTIQGRFFVPMPTIAGAGVAAWTGTGDYAIPLIAISGSGTVFTGGGGTFDIP
ncbi:MAG TPA: hypothetical protein VHO25_17810 [Polyangiaceae bacterium]|nr:hypothetical protein [Polyangiaceae bacterium]